MIRKRILMATSIISLLCGCSGDKTQNAVYKDPAGKAADFECSFTDSSLEEKKLEYPLSTGRTIYVSQKGNDSNDGLSPEKPLKTLSKASTLRLSAGDSILLKRGEIFSGRLSFNNVFGEENNPITIASYGDSEKRPVIKNDTVGTAGIYFLNSSNIVVRDLEVISRCFSRMKVHSTMRSVGIHFEYQNIEEKTYSGIYCFNNEVHGVDDTGEYDNYDTNGSGIILGSVETKHDEDPLEQISKVYFKYNTVYDFGRVGICSTGWIQESGGQNEMHRNKYLDLHFDNNTVYNLGGIGMFIHGGKNCTLNRNTVYDTGLTHDSIMIEGQCGMMYLSSEYSECNYNEVWGCFDGKTGWDAMGIDIDWNTTNIEVKYNHCFDCLGDGIGTMANQHSVIAHNRIENNLGQTNHTGSLVLDNFTCRLYPVPDDFHSITYCMIDDNLIIHNQHSVPAFAVTMNNGDRNYIGNEFTNNHIVYKGESNPSNFKWINVVAPLQFYKFAGNKYYSDDNTGHFRVDDATEEYNLNYEEGAKSYEVTRDRPFSNWAARDLGATYEIISNKVPGLKKNFEATYQNKKVSMTFGETNNDIWHYNIYKVGFDETPNYTNMVGQVTSNTFELDVKNKEEFYIVVQPESYEGVYGEAIKVKVTIA